MNEFSLYIHVPYCARKCPYCDFNTYALPEPPLRAYTAGVLAELERYGRDPEWRERPLRSVFFGGGTPSLLDPSLMSEILKRVGSAFRPAEDRIEVTVETNPDDGSPERLRGYREAGVNRLSFGLQSFSAPTLRALGRTHLAEQGVAAVRNAREAGFDNISVDLIFGAPSQSRSAFREDLQRVLESNIDHVSAYSLTIEQGTPFYQSFGRGDLRLPDEEEVLGMLVDDLTLLAQGGFERYEVSNFARPGKRSVHNLGYWTGRDYLGLGAGAHSFLQEYSEGLLSGGRRWGNQARPEPYLELVREGRDARAWNDRITTASLVTEFFMLGLRMVEGVSPELFERRFGRSVRETFPDVLSDLIEDDFLKLDQGMLSVTRKGLPILDSILERFTEPRLT